MEVLGFGFGGVFGGKLIENLLVFKWCDYLKLGE